MSDQPDPHQGEPPAPAAGPPPRWRRHGQVLWGEWLKPLLVIGLVMFSFRSAVADWNDVPTGSMKPTILEGDRIFINKVAYDLKFPFTRWRLAQWKDPSWGDVVVLAAVDALGVERRHRLHVEVAVEVVPEHAVDRRLAVAVELVAADLDDVARQPDDPLD